MAREFNLIAENPVEKLWVAGLSRIGEYYPDRNVYAQQLQAIILEMRDARRLRLASLDNVSSKLVVAAEDRIAQKLQMLEAVPEPPIKALKEIEELGINNLKLCYLPEVDLSKPQTLPPRFALPISGDVNNIEGLDEEDSDNMHGVLIMAMKKRLIKYKVQAGWRLVDSRIGEFNQEKFIRFPGDEKFLGPVINELRQAEKVSLANIRFGTTEEDRFMERRDLTLDEIKRYVIPAANKRFYGVTKKRNFFNLPSIAELTVLQNLYPELVGFVSPFAGEWCADKPQNGLGFISRYNPNNSSNPLLFSQYDITKTNSLGFRLIGNFG
ncbi:MAG: hypothetical protein PHQ59_05370 [Candidatus Daviesbacteria bacterium]|nr:hypothetical protein [Candidatus Daviesbacteria bacterium]